MACRESYATTCRRRLEQDIIQEKSSMRSFGPRRARKREGLRPGKLAAQSSSLSPPAFTPQ